MFEEFTINQLLELRSLFAETAGQDDEAEKQADVLLILQCIEEELDLRGCGKSA
jgi:hypothetical protein